MIAYRINERLDVKQIALVPRQKTSIPFPVTTIDTESYHITPLKRDPFLGKVKKKKSKNTYKATPKDLNIPEMRYVGFIEGAKKNNAVFLLTIDGYSYIFRNGETVNAITLIDGNSSSVTIRYKKKVYTLKLVV